MKKIIQSSLVLGILFMLSSFSHISEGDVIGTYGVSKSDPSGIELIINENNRFAYKDFSNPSKQIAVTGTWEFKNGHILLTTDNSEIDFHNKWKIVQDGTVAKSRKGVSFYTLIKK